MTLQEHIKHCQELIKKHPKTKDMQIVYAGDDEGNYFQTVTFKPTPGVFATGGDFNTEQDNDRNYIVTDQTNAICIN